MRYPYILTTNKLWLNFVYSVKTHFGEVSFVLNVKGEILLLDMAQEENRKYLPELNVDVRPKYFARSSMLLTCFGFIMALPLGAFVFLSGLSNSGNVKLWASMGVITIIGISWGSWVVSKKIFDKQMESVDKKKELQLD